MNKFMDSIHNKMMQVHRMTSQVEAEEVDMPAAKEILSLTMGGML